MTNIGKNVAMRVDGNKLVIEVDLTCDYGKSKSGKTTIVASYEGNMSLPQPYDHMKIGLNIYKKD